MTSTCNDTMVAYVHRRDSCVRTFEKKFELSSTSVVSHGLHMRRKTFLKVVLDSRAPFLSNYAQRKFLKRVGKLHSMSTKFLLRKQLSQCCKMPVKVWNNEKSKTNREINEPLFLRKLCEVWLHHRWSGWIIKAGRHWIVVNFIN